MQNNVNKCYPHHHRHHMHCCPTPPRYYGPTYPITYEQFADDCFHIPHQMWGHCHCDCNHHECGDLVKIKDCQPHCYKNFDVCDNHSIVDGDMCVPSELKQATKYSRNVHCGETNIGQIVNTYNVVINDNARNKKIIDTLDRVYNELCYDNCCDADCDIEDYTDSNCHNCKPHKPHKPHKCNCHEDNFEIIGDEDDEENENENSSNCKCNDCGTSILK